jgi:hypothetical protein
MGNGYANAELEAEGNPVRYFNVLRKELEGGEERYGNLK